MPGGLELGDRGGNRLWRVHVDSIQACGEGMSSGQVSVPKHDSAAWPSGHRAKAFTPSMASLVQ
jgi:hypothetical protein